MDSGEDCKVPKIRLGGNRPKTLIGVKEGMESVKEKQPTSSSSK